MEKNKRLFQLGFLIVVLLAMGLALLRTSTYTRSASSGNTAANVGQNEQTHRQALAELKDEEILGISSPQNPADREQKRALAVQRYMHRPNLGIDGKTYTLGHDFMGKNPYAALPNVSTGGNLAAGNSYRPKGLTAVNYGKYAAPTDAYNVSSEVVGSQPPGVYRPTAEEQMRAERERAFAPYMTAVPKEQQKQLENQLKGLSSGISRAVAKALLPKSKKETNIEKYLQRNTLPQSASAGPFAPVLEQVSAQKAGVVHSMGQAFGNQAAQEASKIMDSFQSEMAAAINAPGQTPQQIAEKVKQVSQKYEQKLQKMSEDNGFKKFEQERIERDNMLKEALSKQYNSDIVAQAGKIIDEAREKDMILARQGLPAEKYYEQQLANQRERRKALEDVIVKSGSSPKGLFDAENDVEDAKIKQQLKEEEEGKTLGRSYRASQAELTAIDNSLNQERNEKLQTAGQVYGEEGARRIDAIYQRYYDEYMKIWNDPDSSRTMKENASKELRKEVNKQLEQTQNDPQMQQARLNRQVESSLEQIMKDPGVRRASAEQKAALQEKARPILREMYEKVNQIVASDLPDEEKQKQLEQVQAQAQQKLSGQ